MEKLKVGIIGTGNISHSHMGGYKAIPELVDVVACCDLDEEKVLVCSADSCDFSFSQLAYHEGVEKTNSGLYQILNHHWNGHYGKPL